MRLKIETGRPEITALRVIGNHLISGSSDGRVFIHNMSDGKLEKQLNDHITHSITEIDYSTANRLWSVSRIVENATFFYFGFFSDFPFFLIFSDLSFFYYKK